MLSASQSSTVREGAIFTSQFEVFFSDNEDVVVLHRILAAGLKVVSAEKEESPFCTREQD